MLIIDETKLDKSFFQTEEYYDLLRKALEYTVKTGDNEKIRLYARILVRTPLLDNAVFRHRAEDFLLIILELSPADLFVAREVYKQQRDLPEEITNIEQNELKMVKESGWDRLPSICKMDKADFTLSTLKLVRVGMLQQVVGMYVSYIGDAYRITPVFRKLVRLIGELV
jgi:hypothetical protein